MTLYNVELYQEACLRTTVEVEAETAEAARDQVLGWSESERDECFEGEEFSPTDVFEVVSVSDEDGKEVL